VLSRVEVILVGELYVLVNDETRDDKGKRLQLRLVIVIRLGERQIEKVKVSPDST
jgi:hypothetical protein